MKPSRCVGAVMASAFGVGAGLLLCAPSNPFSLSRAFSLPSNFATQFAPNGGRSWHRQSTRKSTPPQTMEVPRSSKLNLRWSSVRCYNQVRCLSSTHDVAGEAPIYRAADSTLHWVDCVRDPCEFHIANLNEDCTKVLQHRRLKLASPTRGSPRSRLLTQCRDVQEESVTVHFFRRDDPDSYIVAYYAGVAFLSAKTGQLTILREIIPPSSRPVLRFNDGAVDSKGRFWLAEIDLVGMRYGANRCPKEHGRPKGSLWRYDPDGQLHLMLEGGLICGNGLAWSPDDKTSASPPFDVFHRRLSQRAGDRSVPQRLVRRTRVRIRLRRRVRGDWAPKGLSRLST